MKITKTKKRSKRVIKPRNKTKRFRGKCIKSRTRKQRGGAREHLLEIVTDMVEMHRKDIFPLIKCNNAIGIDLVNLFIEKYAETDKKTVNNGNRVAGWLPLMIKNHEGLLKYIKKITIPDDLDELGVEGLVTDIKCGNAETDEVGSLNSSEVNETIFPVPQLDLPNVGRVLNGEHPVNENESQVSGTTNDNEKTSETNSNKDDSRKLKIATFVGVLSITTFAISFTQ